VVESELIAFMNWLERWRLLLVTLNFMLVLSSVKLLLFLALLLDPEPPVQSLIVKYRGLYIGLVPFYVA
jgi:hypothetical protein